jgi:hypothetical protein
MQRSLSFFSVLLALTACTTVSVPSSKYRSHGPSVQGYGHVPFGMSKEAALQATQVHGGVLEPVPGKNNDVLKYHDYIDTMAVRVVQSFSDDKKLATKAEVFLLDAERNARSGGDCRGFFTNLYRLLETRYGAPDWPARFENRGGGEGGAAIYTFADSSSITVSYDFIARSDMGLCTVKLIFTPPWAT